MEERKKKGTPIEESGQSREKEGISRREAMKRMAKGVALVGTLGLTSAVVGGQGECGYVNYYVNVYYNYFDSYSNWGFFYYNFHEGFEERGEHEEHEEREGGERSRDRDRR